MNNFKTRQGDTFSIDVDISSLTEALIDTTGWIYTLTLKQDYSSTLPDAQISHTINATDIQNGFIVLTLSASVTAQLEAPSKYFWDIEQKQPSSVGGEDIILTVAPLKTEYKQDKIEIIPDITDNN